MDKNCLRPLGYAKIALLWVAATALVGSVGPARAQVYEKVFSFTEARANSQLAGPVKLLQDNTGNFFGIGGGGPNGYGTVFKLSSTGVLTTLVEFTDNGLTNRGATPLSLVEAADGNFYGTTYFGGANRNSSNLGYGTIFRMTPGGVLTTLVEFAETGTTNRGSHPLCLVQGIDGNFYGAASGGGANYSGTLFRMSPTGTLTTLIDFTFNGASNKGTLPNSLVLGSDGYFYGTTQIGGANDKGTVFRWLPGNSVTTLYEFGGTNGEQPAAALVETAGGVFYGTTSQGGANGLGTVFKVTTTPSLSVVKVRDFTGSSGLTRGTSPTSPLVAGPDGALYGVTSSGGLYGAGTYFRLTTQGALTTLVDFTGNGTTNRGSGPRSLFQGYDGFFYGVTAAGGSAGAGTVFRVSDSGVLSTKAEFIGGNQYGKQPYGGLTQHPNGNLYGTTRYGGSEGRGTVFSLAPSGEVNTIGQFSSAGLLKGRGPTSTMVCAPDGTLYGTTSGEGGSEGSVFTVVPGSDPASIRDGMGGANGLAIDAGGLIYGTLSDKTGGFSIPPPTGRVYRITPLSTFTDLITFPGGGTNSGTIPLAGVTADLGELWGTTSQGGANGLGTVFSMSASSPFTLTTVADFTGTSGAGLGSAPVTRLLQAGPQTFYGATSKGGTNNLGTLFRVQRSVSGLTTLVNFTGVGNVGSPQTFSNAAVITINDRAAASPYPSTISVPAGIDSIGKVRVILRGLEHTYPSDMRFVVVSPSGQSCLLMAAAGSGSSISGVTLTFDDAAAATVPSPISSGTYRPTPNGFESTHIMTDFVAQAQVPPYPPYGTELGNFAGQSATGVWSLYAVDTVGGDTGRVATGWTLEISPALPGSTNVGSEPIGGLVQAQDGTLYGSTSKGGINNLGTVFKLTTAGVLTTLYEFNSYDAKDSGPRGDLMLAADGNIYGTAAGNNGGDGCIFRIVTQGIPSVAAQAAADIGISQALLRCTLNPRGAVTSATIEYGRTAFANEYSIPVAANQTGYSTRQFGTSLTGLQPGTTYYYRIRATNIFGTTNTSVSNFTTLPEPFVAVGAATAVSRTGAQFNGTVNARSSDTSVAFEWDSDPNFATKRVVPSVPGTVTGSSDVTVTAAPGETLTAGQTYYYRIVATNAGGTIVSGVRTFITLIEPVVVSLGDPTGIQIGAANVSGVVNARGSDTTPFFEYATTPSFSGSLTKPATPLATGTLDTTVSVTLSGLAQGTTYYYRLKASNAGGSASPSQAKMFTTLALPAVSGQAASNVGSATATLGATVLANGLDTDVVFEYGPSQTSLPFSIVATPAVVSGNTATAVSAAISGLQPEANYYFRVRATSAAGERLSPVLNFTMEPSALAVTGAGSGRLGASSVEATLNGTVNGSGQSTSVSFDYGTNSGSLDQTIGATPGIVSGLNNQTVSAALSGLQQGTTYYFRVKASNGGGTTLGSIQQFTTPSKGGLIARDSFIFYAGAVLMAPLRDVDDPDANPPGDKSRLTIDHDLVQAPTVSQNVATVQDDQKTIQYQPQSNVQDVDSLVYRVSDGFGNEATPAVYLITFASRAGFYNGSVTDSTNAPGRKGAVALQLGGGGAISTSFVSWTGENYRLKGTFDQYGELRATFTSRVDQNVKLSLKLALGHASKTIEGNLIETTDGTESARVSAFTLSLNAGTGGLPESGLRTAFLRPPETLRDSMGDGYLLMTVPKNRRSARFVGQLPDAEPFSTAVRADGRSFSLIKGLENGGSLIGLVHDVERDGDAAGAMASLFWQKRANKRSRYYRNALETNLELLGMKYPVLGASDQPPIGLGTSNPNARLLISGSDVPPVDLSLQIQAGRVIGIDPRQLQLKLQPSLGTFSGQFKHSGTGKFVPFRGAFRVPLDTDPGQGQGIFRSLGRAGSIRILPTP